MRSLQHLLQQNKDWVERVCAEDPDFFKRLANTQKPEILWIGCSDSRVPATQITDLLPGEIFVHRNVANLVNHGDLNCLSVIQFAVEVLKVKDIIVCGHYSCGGVEAVLKGLQLGVIDDWLQEIKTIAKEHKNYLSSIEDFRVRSRKLCELNVIGQVSNLIETSVVQKAWTANQPLTIHGWIYDVADGFLNDLKVSVATKEEVGEALESARARICSGEHTHNNG